jgi:hypothetical protein
MNPRNLTAGQKFVIPANRVQSFKTSFDIPLEISVIGIAPHMHLLGKDARAYAVSPTGDTIRLISLPVWDFHWQGGYTYKNPIRVPRGSKLYYEASYDNTINNLNNPNNPPKQVTWGEATTDEMLLCYFHWLPFQPGDETLNMETELPTSVNNESMSRGFSIEARPSVTSGDVTLVIESSEDRTISFEIIDLSGRAVTPTVTRTALQGVSSVTLPTESIPQGSYVVRASSSGGNTTCKVLVRK